MKEHKTLQEFLVINKRKFKYKTFVDDNGEEFKVLGIGPEAIKIERPNSERAEFVRHDKYDGRKIQMVLIKLFENELFNRQTQIKDHLQSKYCKENNLPKFAPKEGFCDYCGKQIYNKVRNPDKDHITGCPHCSRSYCD